MTWTLFVEGPYDQVCVRWLLQHLGVDGVKVMKIGGGVSKLGCVKNEILKHRDGGSRMAVLLGCGC